jgi:hypothetical protein
MIPWPDVALVLYVLSAAAVLVLTVLIWKRTPSLRLRFSSLLFATVLVAPHLTVYDLVILAPAFLLLADWMLALPISQSPRWLGTLLYLVFVLPLLGIPVALWTHIQSSVIVMSATVFLLWKVCCKNAGGLSVAE